MTCCLSDQELIECIDEQLTVDRARQAESHLASCAGCKERLAGLRGLADNIAAPAVGSNGGVFIQRTLAAMNEERRHHTHGWKVAAAAAVVLVAAPISFFLIKDTASGPGVFTARGGPQISALKKLTGVEALLVQGEKQRPLLPSGTSLPPQGGLAFRYTNATKEGLYLMAFALDARGDVHWFHPAYSDPKTPPKAVPVPAHRRGVLLPDVVRPEACPAGALRVVTVMSARQRTVKEVEKMLAGTSATSTLPGVFAGDQVQQWLVSVEASR